MGYEIAVRKVIARVPKGHIRARDLARLIGATNALYEAVGAVFVFDSKPFVDGRLKALPDDAVLRIQSIQSGSDISLSLLGIDKVLDAIRKVIDEIRFRRERRKQEEEKTKQSEEKTAQDHETTRRMRIENIQRTMDMFNEIKNMSPEDRTEFMRLVLRPISEIDENRNKLE
ncbi:MAG: hypothetical protein WAQ52_13745 [Terriglobales bacterium]